MTRWSSLSLCRLDPRRRLRDSRAAAAPSVGCRALLDFRGATAPTPTGPWEIDGARLQGSVFSPANGYTAYVVSEEWVGEEGWTVRDSSFNVVLTEDQTLHGT